jgi:hypothetical protein
MSMICGTASWLHQFRPMEALVARSMVVRISLNHGDVLAAESKGLLQYRFRPSRSSFPFKNQQDKEARSGPFLPGLHQIAQPADIPVTDSETRYPRYGEGHSGCIPCGRPWGWMRN